MQKITVAQLKRDIQVGTRISCIGREEDNGVAGTPLQVVPLKEKMQGTRTVTYIDTTGFYLSNDDTRGSFLGWPKSSELERDGKNFNILFTRADGSVWGKNYYSIEN